MGIRFGVFALMALGSGACAATVAAEPVREMTLAVPDTFYHTTDGHAMRSVVESLNETMAPFRLRVVVLHTADAATQIKHTQPDFMIAPSGLEVLLDEPVRTFRIATRKTPQARDARHGVGSTILTLADRADIATLADLKGKRVAAGLSRSMPGWLIAAHEIFLLGEDPESFFAHTTHLFDVFPDTFAALWGGAVDAVIVPTCALERMHAKGLVAVEALKVVGEQTDAALACRRSTALYPDVSLVGFDWTDEKAAAKLTVGLLTAHERGQESQWVPFVDHDAVTELYRNLRVGPFHNLRDVSLKALYARHSAAFHFSALVLVLLLSYGLVLQILVRRKTRQLRRAFAHEQALERAARAQRERLGHLERRNIVNQMSAMIAHEIRSPVGAICNFAAMLNIVLPETIREQDNVRMALESIESQAERIAGIVDRVRAHAKAQKMAHVPCDLITIALQAIRALHLTYPETRVITQWQVPSAWVMGDALELELLVLNLLRNAAEVTVREGEPRVAVAVTQEGAHWLLTVQDFGAKVDDQAFARLAAITDSVKPEGLGMGLSIVRGIVDSHGALFAFERVPEGGLRACVRLEAISGKDHDTNLRDSPDSPG